MVLLDLTMPGMGGVAALRRMAAQWPTLPVIVSSGYSEEALETQEIWHHVAAFLPKPYSLDRLREAVAVARAWAPPGQSQSSP